MSGIPIRFWPDGEQASVDAELVSDYRPSTTLRSLTDLTPCRLATAPEVEP